MHNNIEKFIRNFQTKETIDLFMNGKCYWFAYILKGRFTFLDIYYDTIDGHFFCYDGIKSYDIRGAFLPEDFPSHRYIKWEEYKKIDKLHYERIKRDCIN